MTHEIPRTWSDAAPLLLPVLRTPSRPNNARRVVLFRPDHALVRRPLLPCVDELVTVDTERLRFFVHQGHLQQWGISEDTLFQHAYDNLPPTTGLEVHPTIPKSWFLQRIDGVASSRLALPGWLNAYRSSCQGRPLAFIPTAGHLWITDSDTIESVEDLLKDAWTAFHNEGDPLSPRAYTLDDEGNIEPWTPPDDHPLYPLTQRANYYLLGNEYADQATTLQEWAEQCNASTYIAPFSVLRRGTGLQSFCLWPNVPSLLPQTDWVCLGTKEQAMQAPTVPWRTLQELDLLHAPSLPFRPARAEVGHHPSGDVLHTLLQSAFRLGDHQAS